MVREGAGAGAGVEEPLLVVEAVVVVTSSLQPNHPGVLHVDVEVVDTDVEVAVPVVVSSSSRQPHHPGVLQVSVLVRVLVAVLEIVVIVAVVVGSVPLLSKKDHEKQSVQSTYCSHFGGSSYRSEELV